MCADDMRCITHAGTALTLIRPDQSGEAFEFIARPARVADSVVDDPSLTRQLLSRFIHDQVSEDREARASISSSSRWPEGQKLPGRTFSLGSTTTHMSLLCQFIERSL
jgi:hypothetical protein